MKSHTNILYVFPNLKSELAKNRKTCSELMLQAVKYPTKEPEKVGNRSWANAKNNGVSELTRDICIVKIKGVFNQWDIDYSNAIKTEEN